MIKKITLIILGLFLYSCGFTPMLKNFDLSKINVEEIKYSGPNSMTYLLKNYLDINEKKGSQGLIINLSISENTSSATKNTAGITTEQDLVITINIDIKDKNNINLLNDSISESKRLTVSSNMGNDEEIKKIERDSIIRNLAQKTKFQIQLIANQNK